MGALFQGREAAGEVLSQEQAEGEAALDQERVVEEELCRARGAGAEAAFQGQEAGVEVVSLEQVAAAEALFLGREAVEEDSDQARAVEQEEPGRARGVVVVEVLFQGLAAAAVVLCREPAAAVVERAGPELEVEAAPVGRAQEAAEVAGRKEVEVAVVLGSFPCLVGVLDRDQDWCPGPQEARPGQRHDRPLSHRPR